MMPSKSFVFRFDDVEVREREFTLIKAGKVLTVEPKAFRALLFLLHNPQRLISKEELLHNVWGDTAVTEGSLTRCISLLRSLLGDDIRQPHYIATVATVGYRFVCRVEVSQDDSVNVEVADKPIDFDGNDHVEAHANRAMAGAPADPQAYPQALIGNDAAGDSESGRQEGGSRERGRMWLLAGVAVLVVSLAASIWYLYRPLPPPRITAYTQITYDGHEKILAGVDGSRIYFNSGFIAQVAISGSDIAQVPVALPDPFLLDVSPDGGSFLIQTPLSVQGMVPFSTLLNVRILGGSVRRIAVADNAAFSPDGSSVVYIAGDGDKLGGHLHRAKRWDGGVQTGFGRGLDPRHRLVAGRRHDPVYHAG
jgi:DNA-binding winged helix-turn-helix (wHTH) protein